MLVGTRTRGQVFGLGGVKGNDMGSRGPAPLPGKLKRLRGTGRPGKRDARQGTAESPAPAKLPRAPARLSKVGQAVWRRLVAALNERGLLADLDFGLLESWCSTYAQWREAQAVLEEEGLTFTTPNGYIQQRPEVAIGHKAKLLLKGLSSELGLSSAARARMNVPEPEPPHKSLSDLLFERILDGDDEAVERIEAAKVHAKPRPISKPKAA